MKNKTSGMIYILLMVAAGLVTLYVMLERREDYILLGCCLALVLLAVYCLVRFYEGRHSTGAVLSEQELSDQLTAQPVKEGTTGNAELLIKALYVAYKKGIYMTEQNLNDMNQHLERLEQLLAGRENEGGMGTAVQGQISEEELRKAVKTLVKYNKENTAQLSAALTESLDRLSKEMSSVVTAAMQEVDAKNQNLTETMLENAVTVSDRLEHVLNAVGASDDGVDEAE